MAIWAYPFVSVNKDRAYGPADFMQFYANIFSTGIVPNTALPGYTGFQVLQTDTPSLNVDVGPGVAIIAGGQIMNTAPKSFKIPVPLTTQSRTDSLVIQWNNSTRSGDIIYKQNSTQVVQTSDVYELQIATILVPANASSVSQTNITDTRADQKVCGYSSPFDVIKTGDLLAQFKAELEANGVLFEEWFDNLQNQLDDNQATNLQNQIDAVNKVIVQKEIPEGASLDDYKEEGEFSKKTPTVVTGAPEGVTGAFRLSVRTMLGSSGIFQTLYDYATRAMYYRIGNTSLGFNLPWQKVATTDDIEELTAGDTDWTDLTPINGFKIDGNSKLQYCIDQGALFINVQGVITPAIATATPVVFAKLPFSIKNTHNFAATAASSAGSGRYANSPVTIFVSTDGSIQFNSYPAINSGQRVWGSAPIPRFKV